MAKKFLTSIDLCGNQLIRPVLENVSPNPGDGDGLAKGRIAFNTSDNKPIVYDGNHWRNLQYEIPSGTYLDNASYKSLVAIEALSGTSGFLKKTDADNWELDTNTYLLSNANAVSATKLETPRAFSITGGATAEAISFDGLLDVALNITAINPSKITQTEDYRLVSEVEKADWNAKETTAGAQAKVDTALGSAKDYVNGEIGTVNLSLDKKSDKTHNHTLLSLTERSYNSLTDIPSLGNAASLNTGIASGNIPILGTDGRLDDRIIPKIAISETSVVDSEALMLKLVAETGDIAIRTDISKSFILKGDDANTLENWQELLTPMSPVTSVATKTGDVILTKNDVGLPDVDNTSDMNKPVSTAQRDAIGVKADITYVDAKVQTDVPENALFTDTIYELPDSLDASIINETSERRFVTEAQISSWTSGEGTIPNGEITQYFRGDKQWATLDTTVVPEGDENLYYTDARVKAYSDNVYLGKEGTALKAHELKTARTFIIGGDTGLTANGATFNGADNVNLTLTGSLKVANGGTGLTEAKDGFTRKVMGTLNTSATSYQITHGLGSDVVVQVIEVASNEVVECDIIITSVDMATIRFNKAPNANAYRYIIIG